jgi:chemotaxis protein CheX
MKVEYINPFVRAAFHVIESMLQIHPEKGQLSMRSSATTSNQCNVITGVTGQIEGQVIYGMSLNTADKLASAMLGQSIRTFDQLAASAISELGNMVTGNASTLLSEAGFLCDIAPPSVVRGRDVQITTTNILALVVPIELPNIGDMEIIVSLQERRGRE